MPIYFRPILVLGIFLAGFVPGVGAQEPATAATIRSPGDEAVQTSSPRETLRSFMTAMNRYAEGKRTNDPDLQESLDDAVRCLNLRDVLPVNLSHQGRETAIFLKEIIDRQIVVDYGLPPGPEEVADGKVRSWKVADPGITIERVTEGPRKDEFLFSPSLVGRVANIYGQVKDQPYLVGSGGGAAYELPWILQHVPEWARNGTFLELEWWQWIGLLAVLACGWLVRAVTGIGLHFLKLLTAKTKGEWDDLVVAALTGPLGLIVSCGFWLVCVREFLLFSGQPLAIFQIVLQILLFGSLIWLGCRFADLAGQYLTHLASKTQSTLDDQIIKLVARTMKLFVVLAGVILAAQNLGVNVVSLLAGLSIGGLAVALAMQTTLSNFIGSIIIMIDRSFQVGHWIKIGDAEGEVEEVDFRCTRLRTFYDSVLIIPNAEVMNSKIDNLGMRRHRRVLTSIHITPDTPPEAIEAFVEGIKRIIESNPSFGRKDRFRVVLEDFGTSSLKILLYFFLKVPDLNQELVERQRIFLEILRLARTLGIRFALPVQAIQVERPDEPEERAD